MTPLASGSREASEPYVGLTTRRYASGEIDWTRIRNAAIRCCDVISTRQPTWSLFKAWGIWLAKRSGLRKAKVAVARKLAVILHRMWIEGSEFKWSSKEAANQPA
jgi:transposase